MYKSRTARLFFKKRAVFFPVITISSASAFGQRVLGICLYVPILNLLSASK